MVGRDATGLYARNAAAGFETAMFSRHIAK
jgi:hypothetical protein